MKLFKSKTPVEFNQMQEITDLLYRHIDAAFIREVADELHDIVDNHPELSFREKAVIASVEGLVQGYAGQLEQEAAKPAAAGQPDNLTSRDL